MNWYIDGLKSMDAFAEFIMICFMVGFIVLLVILTIAALSP